MEPKVKDDFTSEEIRQDGISGSLVPGNNGYRRAILLPDVLAELNKVFESHIATVYKDYKKIDRKRKKNIEAYEGESERGETITIPVVKRDANQQLAWLLNTIFSKDPFITVKPLEAGNIQLLVKDENGQVYLDTVTTEEEAQALEDLVNFYLIDKVRFKPIIRTFISELLRDGARPPLLKVIHEPREYEIQSLGVVIDEGYAGDEGKPGRQRVEKIEKEPVYRKVKDGEPTRIEVVPGEKFYIPFPQYDIQKSPFVFQEFDEDVATTKDKIASGVYDFCSDDPQANSDRLDMVLNGLCNHEELDKWRADGRNPSDPAKTYVRQEIHFDFPFASLGQGDEAQDDTEGAGRPTILVEMVPFCAVFDWGSKQFLNCYENNYWHRKRPFFAGRMQERPFSFSGYSTSENCAPFQRLISQLFHLQVQNLVVTNQKGFTVKRTSSALKHMMSRAFKLRPGYIIPVDEHEDVKGDLLGGSIPGVANEIGYLSGENEKMSVVNQFDRGEVGSRTTVGVFQEAQALAKMQPGMILDGIREVIGDAVKCFVQTLIQFSPTGIVIPFQDKKRKSLVERVINFPPELIVDQFAFEVSATAEDETPQALTTRDLMLSGELSKFNDELMNISAAVWMPGVPPPFMILGTKLILGKKRMTERLLLHAKLNPDDYLPTDQDIEQMPNQLLMLQQAVQQMGGMNAAPGGGEVVPFGQGAGPAPGGMAQEPNGAGSPFGNPAPNLQGGGGGF